MREWSPIQLVAATSNRDKLRELNRVVGEAATVVPPPTDLTPPPESEAVESCSIQAAFARVAANKARACSVALDGAWTIASDGGLLVPGLGARWDPLMTRRFAGPTATDRDRAAWLLAMARDLRGAERQLGWIEAVAVASEGRVVATFTAEDPPGILADSLPSDWEREWESAAPGFWIPHVWLCPEGDGKRLANLTEEEQAARRDHWARLAALVRPFLSGLAQGSGRQG